MKLGTVTIVFFVLAAVFFFASAAVFFLLDMWKVIGDLTGHTAKREIKRIRSQNQQSGVKVYKSSKVNAERGKITDNISDQKNPGAASGFGMATEKISAIDSASGANVGTTLLGGASSNGGNEATMLLRQNAQGTVMLNADAAQTSLLNGDAVHTEKLNAGTVLTSELNGGASYTERLNTGAAETSVLNHTNTETTVLGAGHNEETSLLAQNGDGSTPKLHDNVFETPIRLEQEILFVYSGEIVT